MSLVPPPSDRTGGLAPSDRTGGLDSRAAKYWEQAKEWLTPTRIALVVSTNAQEEGLVAFPHTHCLLQLLAPPAPAQLLAHTCLHVAPPCCAVCGRCSSVGAAHSLLRVLVPAATVV